jgi:hypothetical protein
MQMGGQHKKSFFLQKGEHKKFYDMMIVSGRSGGNTYLPVQLYAHDGVGKDALSRICREFSLDTRVVGSDTGSGDLIFLGINAGAVVHLKIILSTFSWIFVSWTDVS